MADDKWWSLGKCVVNYKTKLIVIIAELFRLARIVPGEVSQVTSGEIWDISLPRYCWQRVLELLIPAESAMRRLIVMAGYDRVFVPDLRGVLAAKTGGAKHVRDDERNAAGDAELAICGLSDPVSGPLNEAAGVDAAASSSPSPRFDMFDPMKTFGKVRFFESDEEWEAYQAELAANRAANPVIVPAADPTKRMDPVNALGLWKRIQALHHAAENFDAYVTRYLNWRAKMRCQIRNNIKLTGKKRLGLMRGGGIPGYVRKGEHDIHELVHDVHCLAWDCLSPPKYRYDPEPG
jgi:hypothetical protein